MNHSILFANVVESLYIFYMYNVFQTTVSFHHPLETLLQNQNINAFFKHPVSTGVYESKICMLGKVVSYGLIAWIWLRFCIQDVSKRFLYNTILFTLMAVCSLLMNMNAFLYLLPAYLYEWFIVKRVW